MTPRASMVTSGLMPCHGSAACLRCPSAFVTVLLCAAAATVDVDFSLPATFGQGVLPATVVSVSLACVSLPLLSLCSLVWAVSVPTASQSLWLTHRASSFSPLRCLGPQPQQSPTRPCSHSTAVPPCLPGRERRSSFFPTALGSLPCIRAPPPSACPHAFASGSLPHATAQGRAEQHQAEPHEAPWLRSVVPCRAHHHRSAAPRVPRCVPTPDRA